MIKKRDLKILRKDKYQTEQLMQLYHKTQGEPSQKQTDAIANALDLKAIQVYKFMWDTRSRQDRNTQELLGTKIPTSTVFNIEHKDGQGNFLTPL